MEKYLHHYKSLSDFETDYNSESGPSSFTCSAGTFTYDRHEENIGAYVWKNGNKELWTRQRTPKVGAYDWLDGTGAYDMDNNSGVDITAVGEIEPAKYAEPWVSYTEDNAVNKFKCVLNNYDVKPEVTFDYVGKCKWAIGRF